MRLSKSCSIFSITSITSPTTITLIYSSTHPFTSIKTQYPPLNINMFALTFLTVGLASLANARPQGIGTGSNICPPGCATFTTSEDSNPDPHQLYHFQQMTVSQTTTALINQTNSL